MKKKNIPALGLVKVFVKPNTCEQLSIYSYKRTQLTRKVPEPPANEYALIITFLRKIMISIIS